MMKFEHVTLSYGKKIVLHDLNLNWKGKGMLVLAGINGAGKTSFLKSFVDEVDVVGNIKWNNREVNSLSPQKRASCFGYAAQQKASFHHESVADFMLMGMAYKLSLFEQPHKEDLEKVYETLKAFHLDNLKNCYMDELSGGEVQMLSVARCFVGEHELLLLDEPCAYLDYSKQYAFLNKVKQLAQERGMGVIVSLHDPNLVFLLADELIFLDNKKMIFHQALTTIKEKRCVADKMNESMENAFDLFERENELLIYWKKVRCEDDC